MDARMISPSFANKYYIHKSCGGLNPCIKIIDNSVLPNCVGYAYGRFLEMAQIDNESRLPRSDAERWFAHCKRNFETGQTPRVGAIMCWRKGSATNAHDGRGHVAIVEKINADGSLVVSESNYSGGRFRLRNFSKGNYNLPYLTFQGFVYNPYLEKEKATEEKPKEQKSVDTRLWGIDVSEHNGRNVDLEQIKPHFVIIRAGYGWSDDLSKEFTQKDKQFDYYVKECERLNIPYGLYWMSYALTVEQAKKEALTFLHVIKDCKPTVGLWMDQELDAKNWKLSHGFIVSKENISNICYEFAKIVEDAGYYSGIYCSESWLKYMSPKCDRFDKWVANYGKYNDGTICGDKSHLGTIHQFTSVNHLDKNVMFKGLERYDLQRKEEVEETNEIDEGLNKQIDELIAVENKRHAEVIELLENLKTRKD